MTDIETMGPIDYLVFSGLTTRNQVEVLYFVEVKSGKARLTGSQQSIKKAVENGSVQFKITPS